MGAHNVEADFDGNLSKEKLVKVYNSYIDSLVSEFGTDPYNGTLSTCHGLSISDKKFDTYEEAVKYALDNTNKWEAAMAVWTKNLRQVKKLFTFGESGEQDFNNHPYRTTYARVGQSSTLQMANELTATEGKRLTKVVEAQAATGVVAGQALQNLQRLSSRLTNTADTLDASFFKDLKNAATTYRKIDPKHRKNVAELQVIVTALQEKYCTTSIKQDKPLWVVAGWAAC